MQQRAHDLILAGRLDEAQAIYAEMVAVNPGDWLGYLEQFSKVLSSSFPPKNSRPASLITYVFPIHALFDPCPEALGRKS